jgi:hypothetical protein
MQKSLIISGTLKTPSVTFSSDGQLEIKGNSIPEDASQFYGELCQWIEEYCANPATETSMTIMLKYFNDGGYKSVLRILKNLKSLRDMGYGLTINWYHEKGDSDMAELISFFSDGLKTSINVDEVEQIST